MNACNPDLPPTIWLCSSSGAVAEAAPLWLTAPENRRLAGLGGASRGDFLTSRWLIRKALAEASGLEATQCRPADGRPDASAQPPGWRLSLSHSGGIAGCALSGGTAIGLDIEPLARRPQWQKVVNRWFAPEEQDWLLAGNNPDQFLKAWTLKEAWLKATGRGIANNLQTLRISADFKLYGDRSGEQWRASLGMAASFVVALVYQSAHQPLGCVLAEPIDIGNPAADTAIGGKIDWVWHQQIHPATDLT